MQSSAGENIPVLGSSKPTLRGLYKSRERGQGQMYIIDGAPQGYLGGSYGMFSSLLGFPPPLCSSLTPVKVITDKVQILEAILPRDLHIIWKLKEGTLTPHLLHADVWWEAHTAVAIPIQDEAEPLLICLHKDCLRITLLASGIIKQSAEEGVRLCTHCLLQDLEITIAHSEDNSALVLSLIFFHCYLVERLCRHKG